MSEAIRLPEPDGPHIYYVPKFAVDDVWSRAFFMLEPACGETMTPRDIYRMLQEETALLWIVDGPEGWQACCVTRQHERHGNRWLDVLAIGGKDWHEWSGALNDVLVNHARRINCDAVTAHVRRGLTKWLKALDWKERRVHMEYRIDGR